MSTLREQISQLKLQLQEKTNEAENWKKRAFGELSTSVVPELHQNPQEDCLLEEDLVVTRKKKRNRKPSGPREFIPITPLTPTTRRLSYKSVDTEPTSTNTPPETKELEPELQYAPQEPTSAVTTSAVAATQDTEGSEEKQKPEEENTSSKSEKDIDSENASWKAKLDYLAAVGRKNVFLTCRKMLDLRSASLNLIVI